MQDKNTTQSTFLQLFHPIWSINIWAKINLRNPELDRYVKKLHSHQLIELLILAQIQQYRSLDEISKSLVDKKLNQALDLESISSSQLSRRIQTLPTNIADLLLAELVNIISRKTSIDAVRQEIGELNLVIHPQFHCAWPCIPGQSSERQKAGSNFIWGWIFQRNDPVKSIITEAKKNDRTRWILVVKAEDVINVFDRAMLTTRSLMILRRRNIRFVTRLKDNAYNQELKLLCWRRQPIEEDWPSSG